ncbi:MAG: helix-turn-helix transcriptional regulator [Brevundimonas sp.]|uniref:helix-turn-helix domain-containing protein n=1 Tax=Brevundimonas sp. TaxID=1871086 RepID=UPI0027343CC2|nr:helix-turn-helix transcriptional regulator [Brevundimonas sp.]MDP3403874.1 helix-turn-helix transcriptional regulator [Brevundimonas sp.]MDZ4108661.1 helix-turn-helix transcriptional regulator [Brevundimonas sp.]
MRLSASSDEVKARMQAELAALGEALARLRHADGLSQAEAGERVGMTGQGWGLYEAGKRAGLFRPDIQTRLTAALGATPEALSLERGPPPSPASAGEERVSGVEARSAAFKPAEAPAAPQNETFTFPVQTEEVWPWASSGVVLVCDPGRWPRRGQGCVIETADGEARVRLFDGADRDFLFLKGGSGGLDQSERLARKDVVRLATVVSRDET